MQPGWMEQDSELTNRGEECAERSWMNQTGPGTAGGGSEGCAPALVQVPCSWQSNLGFSLGSGEMETCSPCSGTSLTPLPVTQPCTPCHLSSFTALKAPNCFSPHPLGVFPPSLRIIPIYRAHGPRPPCPLPSPLALHSNFRSLVQPAAEKNKLGNPNPYP